MFKVSGMNQHWTHIVAYLLVGQCIDNSALKEFVMELVWLCSEIAPRVLVVTSHVGTAYDGMWCELGLLGRGGSQIVSSILHPFLEEKQLVFVSGLARVKDICELPLNSPLFINDEAAAEDHLPSNEVN